MRYDDSTWKLPFRGLETATALPAPSAKETHSVMIAPTTQCTQDKTSRFQEAA